MVQKRPKYEDEVNLLNQPLLMQICDGSGLNNEEVAKLGEFLSTHAQAPANAVSYEPEAKVDAFLDEIEGETLGQMLEYLSSELDSSEDSEGLQDISN